jgi:hemolysin activation/secretion protein
MRPTMILAPGALAVRLASCATLLGACAAAHGQPVAPSQVTPPSVRPLSPRPNPGELLVPSPTTTEPAGDADQVDVQVQRVEVEGGLPALADAERAWAQALEGRRATLGEIRRQVALLEDAYHRGGYFLVRVTLPPQRLRDGGTLRVVVLDGFIERVDAAGVPERVRAAVERSLRPLVGVRGLTLHEAERRIRVAGSLAGLRLRSALATGDEPGGTRLLLEGELRSVGLGVTLDNGLARSLGTVEALFNVSLNSPFGQGERLYAALGTGRHVGGWAAGEAPMSLAAAGLVAPIGIEGWSLNTELTQTTLNPEPAPGGLRTRGRLSRATARLTTPVASGSDTALDAQIALEHVAQRQDAPEFDTVISNDRYAALRLGFDATAGIEATSTGITAFTQWSIGLGGRAANAQAGSEPALSRQGASPYFQRMDALLRITQPLGHRLSLVVVAAGQSSFGDPLMLSEQFALSGPDKVSGRTAGSLAVDQGATLRGELSWSLPVGTDNGRNAVMAAPYAFAAAGRGRLLQPTAVEESRMSARSAGLGVRAAHVAPDGRQAQSGEPRDDGRRWQLSVLTSLFW